MNNLADTLRSLGGEENLIEAYKLQQELLVVLRRDCGKEHQRTLTTENNLALTLYDQGNFSGARALAEENAGSPTPSAGRGTLRYPKSLGNLTETLRKQGDLPALARSK